MIFGKYIYIDRAVLLFIYYEDKSNMKNTVNVTHVFSERHCEIIILSFH